MDLTEAALVAGLAGILSGYLLVVRAGFRREFVWGVLNLVPVVSLAFVALYWREARFGFLLSVLGILMVAGALYGGADERLERELAQLGYPVEVPMPVQRPSETPIPNEAIVRRMEEELGEPLAMVEDSRFALDRVQPLPPLGSFRLEDREPAPPREWRNALREELPRLVGERVRLSIAPDGTIREGTLSGATAGSVFLQRMTRQGSVGFEYRLRDVASVSVWDVRGAQPRVQHSEVPEAAPEEVLSEGESDVFPESEPEPEPEPAPADEGARDVRLLPSDV